ncbi:MAG: hypothetical protein ACYSWZ_12135 [Planctomycetota bacterium]
MENTKYAFMKELLYVYSTGRFTIIVPPMAPGALTLLNEKPKG